MRSRVFAIRTGGAPFTGRTICSLAPWHIESRFDAHRQRHSTNIWAHSRRQDFRDNSTARGHRKWDGGYWGGGKVTPCIGGNSIHEYRAYERYLLSHIRAI